MHGMTSLINSYNPVQLTAWWANVDIQFCISHHKVIEYCAKYATKSEPCSQSLKGIFIAIVNSLPDALKAVQKLLTHRNFSTHVINVQLLL